MAGRASETLRGVNVEDPLPREPAGVLPPQGKDAWVRGKWLDGVGKQGVSDTRMATFAPVDDVEFRNMDLFDLDRSYARGLQAPQQVQFRLLQIVECLLELAILGGQFVELGLQVHLLFGQAVVLRSQFIDLWNQTRYLLIGPIGSCFFLPVFGFLKPASGLLKVPLDLVKFRLHGPQILAKLLHLRVIFVGLDRLAMGGFHRIKLPPLVGLPEFLAGLGQGSGQQVLFQGLELGLVLFPGPSRDRLIPEGPEETGQEGQAQHGEPGRV